MNKINRFLDDNLKLKNKNIPIGSKESKVV